MSKQLAKQFGLEIGQRVLYPHHIGSNYGAPIYMSIVKIKDVVTNYKDEVVILTEDDEGYIDLTSIYTKDAIIALFEGKKLDIGIAKITSRLSDYGFKWIGRIDGENKVSHILVLEDDDDEEIASVIKTKKGKKFLIEGKCEDLGFAGEQEWDDVKLADLFVSNTKKWIEEELIKIQ